MLIKKHKSFVFRLKHVFLCFSGKKRLKHPSVWSSMISHPIMSLPTASVDKTARISQFTVEEIL